MVTVGSVTINEVGMRRLESAATNVVGQSANQAIVPRYVADILQTVSPTILLPETLGTREAEDVVAIAEMQPHSSQETIDADTHPGIIHFALESRCAEREAGSIVGETIETIIDDAVSSGRPTGFQAEQGIVSDWYLLETQLIFLNEPVSNDLVPRCPDMVAHLRCVLFRMIEVEDALMKLGTFACTSNVEIKYVELVIERLANDIEETFLVIVIGIGKEAPSATGMTKPDIARTSRRAAFLRTIEFEERTAKGGIFLKITTCIRTTIIDHNHLNILAHRDRFQAAHEEFGCIVMGYDDGVERIQGSVEQLFYHNCLTDGTVGHADNRNALLHAIELLAIEVIDCLDAT